MNSESSELKNEVECEGGVYLWCEAYLDNDFSKCDSLSIEKTKLSSFYSSEQVYSSTLSSDLYEVVLEESSSSIVKIQEISSVDGKVELEVTYKPFKGIESFDLNRDSYRKLCDDYISGKISQEDYEDEITDFVIAEFKKCFVPEDTECSFKCSLSEVDENFVSNPSDLFIPLLEKQGVVQILEVFEEDFKTQINDYSEEYLN